jgi:lipopolysaccharide/colanic/teichoic acid biosynthesis glycosyltransferase
VTSGLGTSAAFRRGRRRPISGRPAGERAPRPPDWARRYRAHVVASDVLSVAVAVLAGSFLGLGRVVPVLGDVTAGMGVFAGAIVLLGLHSSRAWDVRVLGHSPEEFARFTKGVATSMVVLGLLGLAFLATAARPWVFGLIPLAAALATAGRLALRARLRRWRRQGRCLVPVLAIGTVESVAELVDRTRRDGAAGWVVAGACTPTGTGTDGTATVNGVPVLGDLDSVAGVVSRREHRVVAVATTPGWSPRRLHELAWRLEDTGAELVVDPGLMDVAGPRLHVEPVDGQPLLRLTKPVYTGVGWIVKHCYDRIVALVLIMILLPLLVVIAVAIKIYGGGPVLVRETRVGRHSCEFGLLRFRSGGTRVGALLRRYSLDELPQLFNVLAGAMAIVGPRPPHPSEVTTYGTDARRRLLVKPGLTGLRQLSGRRDLSWDESVRLDLRYVENWTPALDLLILRRTIGAVLSGRDVH